MKVTSIQLYSDSDTVDFSFRDPGNTNPYQAKEISGLDADDIIQRYYGDGGSGKRFYDFKLPKRTVVITLGLNPQWTSNESYSDLRDRIYRVVASSRNGMVYLGFVNGTNVNAMVGGFVSKIETDHFTKTPEVKVTIECGDPMLRAPDATIVDVGPLIPGATVVNDPLSTAPHGFWFKTLVLADVSTFTISGDDWWFSAKPVGGANFLANDIVCCSSEWNTKEFYIMRGTTKIPMMDAILHGSIWPFMFPGDNDYSLSAQLDWNELTYHPTYWGV